MNMINGKLVEIDTVYKIPNGFLRNKKSINPKGILSIESIPEEFPEHLDMGANAVVTEITGNRTYTRNRYEDLISMWKEALLESEFGSDL